jgi:hypothetical protein
MRKYIIVPRFGWESFWDIGFGNRIRFWEFAQAINKINNYEYTLLLIGENVDVWGESYFINYPNTVVVSSKPGWSSRWRETVMKEGTFEVIQDAQSYGDFVFDANVIDILPTIDNWNYVRTGLDRHGSQSHLDFKGPNLVVQEYEKTGHRPIFDIEIYDKKLETIIKKEVEGRVGLHLRGDTSNGTWDNKKLRPVDSRKEFIKEQLDRYVERGLDKFYLSTDIFTKPTQRLIKKDNITFHKGLLTEFEEGVWTQDLINKDENIWNDAFYEYDKEEYLWINRLSDPQKIMEGNGGEKQYNWVKELYDEYDIIDYRSVFNKYDTFLHNWGKLRCIDIIDLFSLIYSDEFTDNLGNGDGTFSRFVKEYREKFNH